MSSYTSVSMSTTPDHYQLHLLYMPYACSSSGWYLGLSGCTPTTVMKQFFNIDYLNAADSTGKVVTGYGSSGGCNTNAYSTSQSALHLSDMNAYWTDVNHPAVTSSNVPSSTSSPPGAWYKAWSYWPYDSSTTDNSISGKCVPGLGYNWQWNFAYEQAAINGFNSIYQLTVNNGFQRYGFPISDTWADMHYLLFGGNDFGNGVLFMYPTCDADGNLSGALVCLDSSLSGSVIPCPLTNVQPTCGGTWDDAINTNTITRQIPDSTWTETVDLSAASPISSSISTGAFIGITVAIISLITLLVVMVIGNLRLRHKLKKTELKLSTQQESSKNITAVELSSSSSSAAAAPPSTTIESQA